MNLLLDADLIAHVGSVTQVPGENNDARLTFANVECIKVLSNSARNKTGPFPNRKPLRLLAKAYLQFVLQQALASAAVSTV